MMVLIDQATKLRNERDGYAEDASDLRAEIFALEQENAKLRQEVNEWREMMRTGRRP